MSRSAMIGVAVGLMAAGTQGQVPIFKLWAVEVYEINPDGTYTTKCGVNCPTQDLPPGLALPDDLIEIEVSVEGWDADTDTGRCATGGEACRVSAQDCPHAYCSGIESHGICIADSDCSPPETCEPDRCEKFPLLGAFQWTIDSSTYSNGGPGPGLGLAQLACTSDSDCWCAYTDGPGLFDSCADCTRFDPGCCTCSNATCEDGVCSRAAAAYFLFSPLKNFVFAQHPYLQNIYLGSPNIEFAAASLDATRGGVSEDQFRCKAGSRPICNVDAECPEGTCEWVATSPYYLGTLLLEVTGQSCGTLAVDLLQDQIAGRPVYTFLNRSDAVVLPTPIVEPLLIDLGEAVPCDDGDPCTENDLSCNGTCAGVPIVCNTGMTCVAGVCLENCSYDIVTGAVWADAAPLPDRLHDRPGNCAIDARQPHDIRDAGLPYGWDRLVLSFSCDPTILGFATEDFSVSTLPDGPASPIADVEVDAAAKTVTLILGDTIPPGSWTCITQKATAMQWCAGYLPADASQDRVSTVADVSALISSLNLSPGFERPEYATDINRSGVTNAQDILRLIDLLNGAGKFDPWIAQSLPSCPNSGN